MSGEMPSQNTPATTTLAMIEQGLKVFTSIYKRVFRSMKEEFKKLYRLNSLYMEDTEYFRVLDTQLAVGRADYAMGDMDVTPVADPTMSSEAQKLARANALMQTMQVNPDPMGKAEILLQYYDAIGAKNIDKLLNVETLQQQMQNPPPNPEMLRFQLEIQKAKDENQLKMHDMELKERESIAKTLKLEADIDLVRAQTLKAIADAEAVEPGIQINQYRAYMDDLKMTQQHDREMAKMGLEAEESEKDGEDGDQPDTPPADGGVAPPPSDKASAGSPPVGPKPDAGVTVPGTNLDDVLADTNGDANYAAIGQDLRTQLNTRAGLS
jgi:hypothetical protein